MRNRIGTIEAVVYNYGFHCATHEVRFLSARQSGGQTVTQARRRAGAGGEGESGKIRRIPGREHAEVHAKEGQIDRELPQEWCRVNVAVFQKCWCSVEKQEFAGLVAVKVPPISRRGQRGDAGDTCRAISDTDSALFSARDGDWLQATTSCDAVEALTTTYCAPQRLMHNRWYFSQPD